MRKFIGLSILSLVASASALAGVTVIDPNYDPATLYYQSTTLRPAGLTFGTDGALYVGNEIADTPNAVQIHRVTAPLTGAAFGDALIDPDAVLGISNGDIWVGGGNSIWRLPAGSGSPASLVSNAFTSGSRPDAMRVALNGDVLANDGGRIVRVNPDGSLTDVVTNITNSGGFDLGSDGYLYFANSNRTGIARVLYNPLGPAVDATTLTDFITGRSSISSVDVTASGRVLFGDAFAGGVGDGLFFGALDGSVSTLALVAKVNGAASRHVFGALEASDGSIYVSDGEGGEDSVFLIVPEPGTLALLALGGLVAGLRRRG